MPQALNWARALSDSGFWKSGRSNSRNSGASMSMTRLARIRSTARVLYLRSLAAKTRWEPRLRNGADITHAVLARKDRRSMVFTTPRKQGVGDCASHVENKPGKI